MKVHLGITSALVAFGIGLGFWLGKLSADGEERGAKPVADQKSASANRSESQGAGSSGRRGAKGGKTLGRSPKGGSPVAFIRRMSEDLSYKPITGMDYDLMLEIYQDISWMSAADIEAAFEELESIGLDQQGNMMLAMMLVNRWAKVDGEAAVEVLMASKDANFKAQGVLTALMGWSRSEPELSYQWFEKNREELKRGSVMGAYLGGVMLSSLAMHDMDKAFEKLDSLNKAEQMTAVNTMAQQLSQLPEERRKLVEKLGALDDEEVREGGFSSLVTMWAVRDPTGAIEFLNSRDWPQGMEGSLKTQITSNWAHTDPSAALDWRSNNLGENENAQNVLGHTLGQWVLRDSEGAEAWLAKQPEEVRGDTLNYHVSQTLYWQQQHEEATRWIGQIEGEKVRQQATMELYQSWMRVEKDKALEWRGTLDEETQEQLKALPDPTVNPAFSVPTLEVVP